MASLKRKAADDADLLAPTRRIIIDSDAGCDDAVAIVLACKSPGVTIEALLSVHGNVDMKQATTNLQIMSKLFTDGTVPVFAGAAHPLLGQHRPCKYEYRFKLCHSVEWITPLCQASPKALSLPPTSTSHGHIYFFLQMGWPR